MKIPLAIVAIMAIFAPIHAVMLTALMLIVVDLITGILAARKRKEKIASAGLGRTVIKVVIYQAAIMLGFLTETYLTGPEVPVSKIITGYIGLTELTSIVENMSIISGTSLMKSLVDRLSSKNWKDGQ